MRRVVLDCGVFVSALITPSGVSARLLREIRAGVAEPILSPRLLDELENVLGHDKFRSYIGLVEAREFVDLLRREFTVAPDLEGARHPRLADPGDDYLVALAQGNNAILVSGDKHLLDLAGNGAPVLSPADFLTAFA